MLAGLWLILTWPDWPHRPVPELITRIYGFTWNLVVDWIVLLSVFLMLGLQFRPVTLGLCQGLQLLRRVAFTPRVSSSLNSLDAAMVCLGGMVGVGSILGMARLLISGGPGAIVWFVVAGLLGSSAKFAETYLAVRFREARQGRVVMAGPMVFLRDGLDERWRWLSTCFALCGCVAVFGLGSAAQVDGLAITLQASAGVPSWISGVFVALIVFVLASGGITRIAGFCRYLVPAMLVGYWAVCISILAIHPLNTSQAFVQIVQEGFSMEAIFDGTLAAVLSVGVIRAVSATEIGAGTVSIVQGLAQPFQPVAQAGVSVITGLGTVLTGALTGLVMVTVLLGSAMPGDSSLPIADSRDWVLQAFAAGNQGSAWFVDAGIVLFALTTMLVHCFIGEQCISFLAGERARLPFRLVWVGVLMLQAIVGFQFIWILTQSMTTLMVIPNMFGLALLSTKLFHWVLNSHEPKTSLSEG
ncbi:MAG: alanine:cation symporter family protein [Prochlorococcus sp.]